MKTPAKLRTGLVVLTFVAAGCDRGTGSEPVDAKKTEESKGKESKGEGGELESPVVPEALVVEGGMPTLTTVDDAARTRAGELTATFERTFSGQLANRHNALALLHLANTSTDVGLAAAALDAISRAYGPKQTDKQRAFDADYFAVVRYRLMSKEPRIEEAAFAAAKEGMEIEPVDAELHALLLDRAYHHPRDSGRLLALAALSTMKSPARDVDDAFMHALDDESTSMIALTLERLKYTIAQRLPDQERLERRLTEFMAHADPGVRGMAAMALADRTPSDDGERRRIAGLLAPLSRDPHPFVRLCTLEARVEVKDPTVLPLLVELLDDQSETKFVVEGWVLLDGSRQSERLGSWSTTVSNTVVEMLETATRHEVHAFDPTPIDYANEEASRKRALDEAKAWAAANAALLGRG